jgi:hypothetical protein
MDAERTGVEEPFIGLDALLLQCCTGTGGGRDANAMLVQVHAIVDGFETSKAAMTSAMTMACA